MSKRKCEKDNDCENGGSCTEQRTCKCLEGTHGNHCEEIIGCEDLKCEATDAECQFDFETHKAICVCRDKSRICGILKKENFQMAFLEKAKKQDLVLLAEELGQKVSDKMTNIELRNIIIGSKDYEEEFVRDQLSVILEERFERESEEKSPGSSQSRRKIARQHANPAAALGIRIE
ncbi:hypothetical protein TNCV_3693151 [Trichonephila clavipes]|nr:hypothetical protein TNCV_3693151 [Trichonephila clavipes]